ncbi:MAG: YhcH/YjgK/YiaL family protein, partial [Muribaculaceae bacterium]|nr:YhcH/YjgK/YiaL family protein [Muribaculaceae bacterium]
MRLKTTFLSLLLASSPLVAMAEGVYTRQCDDQAKIEQCTGWMESGAWRNGFEKADPHESVNAV